MINPSQEKTDFNKDVMEDLGNTTNVMRPSEGANQFLDKMNQAYIRKIFPDTHILSGQ